MNESTTRLASTAAEPAGAGERRLGAAAAPAPGVGALLARGAAVVLLAGGLLLVAGGAARADDVLEAATSLPAPDLATATQTVGTATGAVSSGVDAVGRELDAATTAGKRVRDDLSRTVAEVVNATSGATSTLLGAAPPQDQVRIPGDLEGSTLVGSGTRPQVVANGRLHVRERLGARPPAPGPFEGVPESASSLEAGAGGGAGGFPQATVPGSVRAVLPVPLGGGGPILALVATIFACIGLRRPSLGRRRSPPGAAFRGAAVALAVERPG
jgi:hypothetical protein